MKFTSVRLQLPNNATTGKPLHVLLDRPVKNPSPFRVGCDPGSIGIDFLPIYFPTTGIDINIACMDPSLSLPQIANHPEEQNHWRCQILREKALGRGHSILARRRHNGGIELESR